MLVLQISTDQSDSDVLASHASDLERAPGAGIYQVWANSNVYDGTISVVARAETVLETSALAVHDGEGEINVAGQPLTQFVVGGGEKVTVNYTEGGAARAMIRVSFTPLDEWYVYAGYLTPRQVGGSVRLNV